MEALEQQLATLRAMEEEITAYIYFFNYQSQSLSFGFTLATCVFPMLVAALLLTRIRSMQHRPIR
jgi:hypothetical protein